jgi:hypothetical protein
MMRRMGADARTTYEWTDAHMAAAHEKLTERIPVADIAAAQRERDRKILALLQLKASGL